MAVNLFPLSALKSFDPLNVLNYTIKFWFLSALIGQWFFAVYVLFLYSAPFFVGFDHSEIGIKQTTGMDRLVFFTHILPTIYLAFFGILQLVPNIRNTCPNFHRWNGRIFLILGLLGASTGLYMQLMRDVIFSEGVVLNGVLIIVSTYFTWYFAVKKRYQSHMRWAIHTFILVNGVWSFRTYLMGWIMINQGPNGNTPNVDGPMDVFISFACYLFPMFVVEVYFWLQKQQNKLKVWAGTIMVMLGSTATLVGVLAAISMMWLPRIDKFLNYI